MPRLAGSVAIVTGAARGIGLAIATRFADEGASVVMADVAADALARAAGAFPARGPGGRPSPRVCAHLPSTCSCQSSFWLMGSTGRSASMPVRPMLLSR